MNKLTHEDYLQKLKDRNIEIIPLEKYKGSKTKILHKCTCGNEWEAEPSHVAGKVSCGCNYISSIDNILKRNSFKYKEILKNKNINVYPLEPYTRNIDKILHKCTCGNEWKVAPKHVKRGVKCGCLKNINIETYRNRRTILYYIKVDNLWKIGLSIWEKYKTPEDNILKYRYSHKQYKSYNFKIIQYKIYEDGADAFIKEKNILDQFDSKKNMYISEDMNNFGGYTELFFEDILGEIML